MILVLGLAALAGAIALLVRTATASAEADSPSRMIPLVEAYGDRDRAPAAAAAVRRRSPGALLVTVGRPIATALSRSESRASLPRRLDLAGNPPRWSADRMLGAKGCGLLAGGALALLLTLGHSPAALVLGTVAGAAVGFVLPDILLYNTGLKRQDAIQKGLADAIDLLVICVQAGLGFDAALAQVARTTTGPLAGEFSRVLQEIQMGASRREAFDALGERATTPDVRHFVGAVVQADALGVPIADVLREQGREMRVRRRQAAEAQAQKVPVTILFPLMLLILPALFIVVLGPAVLRAMSVFS